MPLEDISEIEVFGEAVPPEDTSASVPPTEEPVLRVTRVGGWTLLPGPRGWPPPPR